MTTVDRAHAQLAHFGWPDPACAACVELMRIDPAHGRHVCCVHPLAGSYGEERVCCVCERGPCPYSLTLQDDESPTLRGRRV